MLILYQLKYKKKLLIIMSQLILFLLKYYYLNPLILQQNIIGKAEMKIIKKILSKFNSTH